MAEFYDYGVVGLEEGSYFAETAFAVVGASAAAGDG